MCPRHNGERITAFVHVHANRKWIAACVHIANWEWITACVHLLLLLLLLKKVGIARRERRLTLHQFEDPSPTIRTHRMKEEKGKTAEDKKGASSHANKKALALFFKPASPTPSNTESPRSFHRDTDKGMKVLRYCEVLQRGSTYVYYNVAHQMHVANWELITAFGYVAICEWITACAGACC